MNPQKQEEVTGGSNQLILDNMKRMSEYGIPLTIRTPIVPGYTDSQENIGGIAAFVSGLPTVNEYELLPYHNFGESKYAALGKTFDLQDVEPPSEEKMLQLTKIANTVLNRHGKYSFYMKDNKKEGIQC